METKQNEVVTICPACGAVIRQMKMGFTPSGSQRYKCGLCNKTHTPVPRAHAYSEEVRKKALQLLLSGLSGRKVGLLLGINKANVFAWAKKTDVFVDKSKHRNRPF